jgi:flavin reductase (DIM6/NTAB) family NADH-FMN oxidoreductase RutF
VEAVDRDVFDSLMTGSDTAMVVVTTSDGEERAGCLVGFHTQCSIEPPRYAIWLSKANRTYRVGLRAEHFAIHFLDQGDGDLAELFGGETGDDVDKFARAAWEAGPDGVPLLSDCPSRVLARRIALLDDGGDHVCIEAEAIEAWPRPGFVPLRLASVQHLDPGHDAD